MIKKIKEYYCGFIAIIGKSNVGKSTLINSLIGEKISITADKPQTTRKQILGIKTKANKQAVYIDTPGISLNVKSKLNKIMNRNAKNSFNEVDLILFVIDPLKWDAADQSVLNLFTKSKNIPPIFLLINKIDLLKNKNLLLSRVKELTQQYNFTEVFPISAKKNMNLNILENAIFSCLPKAQHHFSAKDLTDQNLHFRITEIIREKLISTLDQELPYVINVQIDNLQKTNSLYTIDVTIWVEKIGQKKIVIGNKGSILKKVGMQSRLDIEQILKHKVFLSLYVQVKPNWTNDQYNLKKLYS